MTIRPNRISWLIVRSHMIAWPFAAIGILLLTPRHHLVGIWSGSAVRTHIHSPICCLFRPGLARVSTPMVRSPRSVWEPKRLGSDFCSFGNRLSDLSSIHDLPPGTARFEISDVGCLVSAIFCMCIVACHLTDTCSAFLEFTKSDPSASGSSFDPLLLAASSHCGNCATWFSAAAESQLADVLDWDQPIVASRYLHLQYRSRYTGDVVAWLRSSAKSGLRHSKRPSFPMPMSTPTQLWEIRSCQLQSW